MRAGGKVAAARHSPRDPGSLFSPRQGFLTAHGRALRAVRGGPGVLFQSHRGRPAPPCGCQSGACRRCAQPVGGGDCASAYARVDGRGLGRLVASTIMPMLLPLRPVPRPEEVPPSDMVCTGLMLRASPAVRGHGQAVGLHLGDDRIGGHHADGGVGARCCAGRVAAQQGAACRAGAVRRRCGLRQ